MSNQIINGTVNVTSTATTASSGLTFGGISLLDYGLIFLGIMILGIIVLLLFKFKNRKKKGGVPAIVLQPTATGLKVFGGMGYEEAINTQKMLDMPFIGRKLNYPHPAQLMYGTFVLLQTDEITYRPLILRTPDSYPKELRDVLAKVTSKTNWDSNKAFNEPATQQSGEPPARPRGRPRKMPEVEDTTQQAEPQYQEPAYEEQNQGLDVI